MSDCTMRSTTGVEPNAALMMEPSVEEKKSSGRAMNRAGAATDPTGRAAGDPSEISRGKAEGDGDAPARAGKGPMAGEGSGSMAAVEKGEPPGTEDNTNAGELVAVAGLVGMTI